MTYDKEKDIFTVNLRKRYKPSTCKYVTINNEFYIDGDTDLFTGLELKQVQFILFCLSIADNQIVRYREINKDSLFLPKYISMKMNHESVYGFLGNHPKRNIELIQNLFSNETIYKKGFYSTYSEDVKEFSVIIDTSIFIDNRGRNFTKVFICDIMRTKSLPSIYVKMKLYKFINSSNYIEGVENIGDNEHVLIFISKEKFKIWSNCGKSISKYMKNCLISINKENDKKITWGLKDDDVNKGVLILRVSRKEYSDHIILNGFEFEDFVSKEDLSKNKTEFKYII